jgi:hypothetical protein
MSIRPWSFSILFVLVAACSRTLYQSYSAVAPELTPDSTYACVTNHLEKMGFKRTAYNVEEMRIAGRRNAAAPRQSNALALLFYDELEAQVASRPTGGAEMTVKASSFMVTQTARGPTTDEMSTYPEAKAAADSLIKGCGGTRG